jgi:hypothetical protein
MIEKSHDDLRYRGTPGEIVNISVTAQGTVQMVVYKIDNGPSQPLPPGQEIQLQLHPGTNVVQITFDSVPPGGVYTVIVKSVTNEPNNECVQVFTHIDSIIIAEFTFFA